MKTSDKVSNMSLGSKIRIKMIALINSANFMVLYFIKLKLNFQRAFCKVYLSIYLIVRIHFYMNPLTTSLIDRPRAKASGRSYITDRAISMTSLMLTKPSSLIINSTRNAERGSSFGSQHGRAFCFLLWIPRLKTRKLFWQ